MAAPQWRVRLTAHASRDIAAILDWTAERFGSQQAASYGEALAAAVALLGDGPDHASARKRDDIMPGLWLLRLSVIRPRSRHFLAYRVADEGVIAVLRILHDAMDLQRHLPGGTEDN